MRKASRGSRLKRAAVVGFLVGVIVFGPIPAAMAHYVYHSGYAHKGAYCVKSRSEISHGMGGGGYVRVDTWSEHNINGCGGEYDRPAFHIKAEWILYYRPSSESPWGWCEWDVGSQDTLNLSTWHHHVNPEYVDVNGDPPCSTGDYATLGNSQVLGGDTKWRPQPPNWNWSGIHRLEADLEVSCPASDDIEDCVP